MSLSSAAFVPHDTRKNIPILIYILLNGIREYQIKSKNETPVIKAVSVPIYFIKFYREF